MSQTSEISPSKSRTLGPPFPRLAVQPIAFFAGWPLIIALPAVAAASILGKKKISFNFVTLVLGTAFCFLIAFKRSNLDEGSASLIAKVLLYLCVLVFVHGETINRSAALSALRLLVVLHLAFSVLFYTTGTPILLFQSMFNVEQFDLIRFGTFRNPGTFNEPSTYCYAIIMLMYFARPSAFWRVLTYATVLSSTSLGGILLLTTSLIFFEKPKFVIIGYSIITVVALYILFADLLPEYFAFRLELLTAGSDQSLLLRTEALPNNVDDIFWFGYSWQQLKTATDLYAIKGNGFIIFGFLTLGIVGPLLTLGILISLGNLTPFRVVFLLFSKFDLLSPLNLLVMIGKRDD